MSAAARDSLHRNYCLQQQLLRALSDYLVSRLRHRIAQKTKVYMNKFGAARLMPKSSARWGAAQIYSSAKRGGAEMSDGLTANAGGVMRDVLRQMTCFLLYRKQVFT